MNVQKQISVSRLAFALACLLLFAMSACQSPAAQDDMPVQTDSAQQVAVSATAPLPALSTSPPQPLSPTLTHPATPTTGLQMCSPLEGYALADLSGLVSNPYNPPAPGSDDPHQGVDFADLLPGSQVAVSGRQVRAVLPGSVALTQGDRFPYGRSVLVEIPLWQLPSGWTAALNLPTTNPSPPPNSLSCPAGGEVTWVQTGERSLYILYAHLESITELQLNDPISCGQMLGTVGMSGNALNPHLHLEMRVGPSGARFSSMAHYDNSASNTEMANYCAWRVGGQFQLLDPLEVLALAH